MKKGGFGFWEALIVILVIIGLIVVVAKMFLGGEIGLRDAERLSDIRRVRNALQLYYLDQGRYPINNIPQGLSGKCLDNSPQGFNESCGQVVYMTIVPTAPLPRAEGVCSQENSFYDQDYTYFAQLDGSSYAIRYCLAKRVANMKAGLHWATPQNIADP
ncbi:MAG: hypothetical protein PHG83_01780 [Patescibacteria group bacterium]|nr:hypothetical protein [Patescibacteria group bacterium]